MMETFLLEKETLLRLSSFALVLMIMGVWECAAPRRHQAVPRRVRWPHNLGLTVLNSLILRLVFPMTAIAIALMAKDARWGVFNLISAPSFIAIGGSILALDFIIYLQHRLFHHIPLLWRLHRMHHTDLEIDVTTGTRFHPLEIILSMILKIGTIIALGAPAAAVFLFEIILNACAMFNHSNVKLPLVIDQVIRKLIVTPDMHRVHHSILPQETHSNFGFNLSVWDRWLGTYNAQPKDGHEGMTIGLPIFRNEKELRLDQLIVQPFKSAVESPPDTL